MAKKIGVSGKAGSFSEKAAKGWAAENNGQFEGAEIVYLISAEGVLAALEAGTIDIGVFPIENSTGGMVKEALEAMSRHNFRIVEIQGLAVHHCLLAAPGMSIADITVVTSHVQALTQCAMSVKRVLPHAVTEEYPDTAQAAEDLAKGLLPKTTAIIASLEAGNRNALEVLARSFEDLNFNITNFVIAERRM